MKKTGIVTCLLMGLAGPLSAQAADRVDCMKVTKAVSDMQLALAGMGNLNETLAKLESVGDQVPAMEEALNGMHEVVANADSDAPLETMDMDAFDRAEARYENKYRQECDGD